MIFFIALFDKNQNLVKTLTMRKPLLPLLLFASLFILSCGSSKKATGSGAGTGSGTSAAVTDDSNPTLDKPSARMLDDNTFQLEGISNDPTYAYDEKNAVKVGGVATGPTNERRYLNALLGPNGEKISYTRLGSCCPTPSKNGLMGSAILDIYEIKYKGLDKPIRLYINMYDPGILKAPKGFTYKK